MPYRRWFRLWSYRRSGRLPAASSTDIATRLLVPRDRAISAVITKDRGNDLIDVAATTRGRLRAGPIVGSGGEASVGEEYGDHAHVHAKGLGGLPDGDPAELASG